MIGLIEFYIFAATLALFIYIYFKWVYSYFGRNNVPYIPPVIFFGNLMETMLGKKTPVLAFDDLYNHEVAKDEPFVGIYLFNKPGILIRDPELVKQVLVKDFNYFSNRMATPDPHNDIIGAYNLFFMKNPEWKTLRSSLSSFFSSGKLKNSSYLIQEAANELDVHLSKMLEKKTPNWDGIEFREICARYTTDVIATVAFGVKANSIEHPNVGFRKHGAAMFDFTIQRALQLNLIMLFPKLAALVRATLLVPSSSNFLRSSINHVIEEREKSKLKRNDLIDILIELKKTGKMSNDSVLRYEGDVLVAQAAFFFLAGFETSSATMSFSLYNLAKNPEIQKKVREEIKNVLKKSNGEITYEAVSEMEYLSAIIYETTRLYPVIAFLDRECTPPAGEEGYSLKPYGNFVIPKGMPIYISLHGLHTDPKYFPNPLTFDPDRFLTKNKQNMIQYTYLGFGSGPHYCIGERLAILQSKMGLVNILKNYRVQSTHKTPVEIKYKPKAFNLQPTEGLYLDIVRDPLI